MKSLLRDYRKRKKEIKKRLRDFRSVYKKGNNDIFAEMCFCIFTPQARAVVCDSAVRELQKRDVLLKGSRKDIRPCLKGVRFPNNKTGYVVSARDFFKNGKGLDIKSRLDTRDVLKTRVWLVKNVKGLGYKEASHFLRNIGFGKDLAILDRHILKNLKRCGVIRKIPGSLSRKDYIKIENRMKRFFKKIAIPMEEIDLLFWSKETGMIFK